MRSPVRDFESRGRAIFTAITVPAGKRSYIRLTASKLTGLLVVSLALANNHMVAEQVLIHSAETFWFIIFTPAINTHIGIFI